MGTLKKNFKTFAQTPNDIVNDNKLSWKAKGIATYLCSKPNGWVFNMKDIVNKSMDGLDSVQNGIKELINIGYLIRERVRNEKGEVKDYDYIITLPEEISPVQGFPLCRDFPCAGKSASYNNTDLFTNNDVKKKESMYFIHTKEKEGSINSLREYPADSTSQATIQNASKNDSFALVSDFDSKDDQSIPPDNKKPSKGKIPTKQQVLAIYDAYPRKTAKQMGLRAIEKAIKKGHSPEMLLEKTNLYAQKMSWQDKQYIPFPSTWFNQERFLDDPSAWEAPSSNNNGRYSSQRKLSPDQIIPRTKREILMTEPWRADELKNIDDDDTPF